MEKRIKRIKTSLCNKTKFINRRTNKIHFRNKRNNRKPKLVSRTLHRYEKIKLILTLFFLYTYNEYMSKCSYKEEIMLNDDQVIDLSELFKIFGDSTRIKIINCLLEKELCVSEIAELTSSTQSAISHQLRILKQSKLVKYRKEGQSTIYSLADDHVEKIFRVGVEHIDEI